MVGFLIEIVAHWKDGLNFTWKYMIFLIQFEYSHFKWPHYTSGEQHKQAVGI